MFVRKKLNRSGSTSVQIIDKSKGKYEVYRTVGSSRNVEEVKILVQQGKREIAEFAKQWQLPFNQHLENEYVETFMESINTFHLVGPELLLGKLFDEIGFNAIEDKLFRHLVITRLVYPVSKLKTVDYLYKFKGIEMSVYSIYRYLDKLHAKQIEKVKQISYKHTLSLLGNKLSVVFYDVTTLYFEASDEDDLRKMGFSKDGRPQQPQIVLGLLVSEGGYPIDYDIFEGNQYEGDTLIPILEHFISKHNPEQLIVVADSGLISKKNIQALEERKIEYILGGRIKNETDEIKLQIKQFELEDKQCTELKKQSHLRLIINYSKQRAKKDAQNRKKGYEKLKAKIKSGKLNKSHINNKGYNKYLKLSGEVKIKLDEEKYKEDGQWDGLKGYVTNSTLSKEEVIHKYNQLWQIEKAFRISKSDLQIRPIYHHLKRRIEAHICISFAACKIYKELDRQLKEKGSGLSPEKVIDILKTIFQVSFQTPYSYKIHNKLVLKNQEQLDVVEMFGLSF